jgi:hypothetical protein
MGGTVATTACPTADNTLGVCSGVDQGGNHFEQVFYNDASLMGVALSAGIDSLMLNCIAINGTWSTTYDGTFGVSSGGAGASGGSGGGAGGSSGGGGCAQLLACCDAASATYKTACMAAYDSTNPSDTACQSAYTGLKSLYCP